MFVGGMACSLLFTQESDPHEGTIDIDVVLNTAALADCDDETLEDKLLYALYQQEPGRLHQALCSRRIGRFDHSSGLTLHAETSGANCT